MDNKVLLDALEYAWTHPKRNNTFTGEWSYLQLAFALRKYSTRIAVESNRITGIAVFEVGDSIIHVRHILCDTREALRTFLSFYKENYRSYKLSFNRRPGTFPANAQPVKRIYG